MEKRPQSSRSTHRQAEGGRCSPTYQTWRSMKSRCSNPNIPDYHRYGGRGIAVCERWQSFENFFADMGERPEGMSLDRFPDKNGNYEPGNCRWATEIEQKRNTRRNRMIEINGVTRCLAEWAEVSNINYATLTSRLNSGWSPEKAICRGAATQNYSRRIR